MKRLIGMSTATGNPKLSPPSAAEPPNQRLQRMERFIDGRIEKTSAQLKLVDLAGAIMTLFGGALVYLLALALIDHWVMPLGFWGRLLALLVLLGVGGWYLFTRVSDLVMRRINPVYAAQTIEESTPSLKNSLINFLMFRSNRSTVRSVVYEAVEQQAANNLSQVNIDAAVDRSRLIRTGYVLAAIMFICAVYAVLSPKNPLQTVARVLAPWSDLTPPTRVRITDVQPGDIDVYQGRSVEISAVVHGIDDDEPVTLYYTTADRQYVDEPTSMTLGDDGYAYRCEFSPGGEGVQQDTVYRIGAGDAMSGDYLIRVRPAPSILVREVQYDYPEYTGLSRKVVQNEADVQAVEGTMVTIRAAANLPIEQARLELMPSDAGDGVLPEPLPLVMKASDKEAVARFRLSLLPDRLTPKHFEYLVSFRTADGERSPTDVRHRIQVVPDLAPEVEILTPMKREIEIPVNGKQQFEVRALDPDFGISRVTLHGVRGGRETMTETLLLDEKGRVGQVLSKHLLAPKNLGLAAGDEMVVWASAADNRADAKTGSPLPNSVRTGNYLVRITAAEEFPRQPEDTEPESDPNSEDNPQDSANPSQADPNGGEQSDTGQGDPSQDPSGAGEPNDPQQDGDPTNDGGSTGTSEENQGSQGDQPEDASNGSGSESEATDGAKPDQAESTNGGSQNAAGGEQPTGSDPGTGEASSSEGDNGGTETTDRPAKMDGSEDGDIIEQLNRHRREQNGSDGQEQAPENPGGEGGDGDPNAETNPQGQDHSNSGAGSSTDEQLGGPKDPNATGEANSPSQDQNNSPNNPSSDGSNGGNSGNEKKSPGDQENPGTGSQQQGADDKSPKSDGAQQQNTGADGQKRGDDQAGQEQGTGTGGEPQGGDKPKQDGSEQGGGQSDPKNGGQGDNSKPGAGQESEKKQGSPESQGGNQQRTGDKKSDNPSGNPKDGEGGESPATNPKSSDSAGADDGDKKGGGKQGGGQSAKQAGNDSAGSTSAGDEGGDPAGERGDGPTGEKAGGGPPSERPTGNPGGEDGPGSSTRPNPDGSNTGDAPGASPSSSNTGPQNDTPSTGPPSDESGQGGGEGGLDRGQGTPLGGGEPSNDPVTDTGNSSGGLPGDRLKRAKEETVLALDTLEHMSEEEVRDVTGHSKKDLEAWAERYRTMLREAEQPGNVDAKRKLDNELRSLGLTPRRSESRGGTATNDSNFGDRETGRSEPPAKYKELFDAYRKSGR